MVKRIRLNSEKYQSRKRVFAAEYSKLFLEMIEAHRGIFADLELAIITHCVGLIGLGNFLQRSEGSPDYRDLNVIIGEAQRPATAYAIAEATGIPRSTVIRKLDTLAMLGLVQPSPAGGFILTPGRVLDEPFQTAFDKQAQVIVRVINALLAAEIAEIVE